MKRNIYKLLSRAKQSLFALAVVVSGKAYSQTTYTFNYTGNVQTLPLSGGNYKLECWGADGGDNMAPYTAGKGGYSTGTLNVVGTAYIYVGGKGITGLGGSGSAPGGYNGGGTSGAYTSTGYGMGSGGGATHIATATGLLSTLSGNQSAVAIVAGGGGGAGSNHGPATLMDNGGNAGGLTGGNGQTGTYGGTGGTQATGGTGVIQNGSFGQGGNNSGSNTGGGGGGGWYGGGAAQWEGSGGGSGYIGGVTNGTTVAFGQPGFVANPDVTGKGYVIITRLCNISLVPSKNPICVGNSITLTTDAASGITWGNSPSTGNSISVSPLVTTSYSVTGTSTANCQTTNVITIIVHPLPVIASVVSPTTLCVGKTATISATGANTYTWSTGLSGSTTTMSPGVTTTFSVTATSINGCVNSNTVSVPVNSNSITLSSSSPVCEGGAVTLMASGAITYTWSTGSLFASVPVSPTVLTNYVVSGTDIYGCVLSNVIALSPAPLPNVSISASKSIICKGESVILTALGAATYTWNDGTVAPSITRTLPADVSFYYSVTGTDASGCIKTSSITIIAAKCLGVNEIERSSLDVAVMPNPGTGLFNLQVNSISDNLHVSIYNALGMLIKSEPVNTGNNQLDIQKENAGIYFVRISDQKNVLKVVKLIKE